VYVIYNRDTTVLVGKTEGYKSERAAKAALTKMPSYKLRWVNKDKFAIAERNQFATNIEKKKTVRNLLSGEECTIPVNTPRFCDPSSEAYWSM
jgi:hypothetical protein